MEPEEFKQFELGPGEEYDKFCGKVFLTTKKNIILHCTLCKSKYFGFESYVNHLTSQHLTSDSIESLDEEYQGNEEEDEELSSMHEKELPIKLLQKKTNISVHQEIPKGGSDSDHPQYKKDLHEKSGIRVVINAVEDPLPTIIEIENRSRPVQIVSSEKGVFACPHCPQRFPLEYSLRHHVKEHDKDRLFKCNICGVQFKSNALLRCHVRRHEKHKAHKCTECERSFVTQSELQYHMRNHNGEKPYQCENCGVRYAYRSTLKMHRKRHHTFQKDYVCPLCSQAFYSSRFLRDHMTKHTNEPSYECEKCGKKFNTSSCYGRHKAQHRKREEAEKEKNDAIIKVEETFVNVLS